MLASAKNSEPSQATLSLQQSVLMTVSEYEKEFHINLLAEIIRSLRKAIERTCGNSHESLAKRIQRFLPTGENITFDFRGEDWSSFIQEIIGTFTEDKRAEKFSPLGVAWYRYEVIKNQLNAEAEWINGEQQENPAESENKFETLCVDDIANDSRLFRTSHLLHPATLKHALKAEFLNLIKIGSRYGWLEALFPEFLEMSINRPHYLHIQTKDEAGKILPHPQIIATGLIHDGCDLTRDSAFRHAGWQPLINRSDFEKALVNNARLNGSLIECDLEKIPENPQTIAELEEGLIDSAPGRVCEFIHFTGKPQNLYVALQAFTQRMAENGKDFAFAIAEKHLLPTMVNIVEGLTGRKAFLTQSQYQINQEDPSPTCKVILLNKNMGEALREVSLEIVMLGMRKLGEGKQMQAVIEELRPIWENQKPAKASKM